MKYIKRRVKLFELIIEVIFLIALFLFALLIIMNLPPPYFGSFIYSWLF
jgi:hypothetical protein